MIKNDRSDLYKEFNYGERVCHIYDLQKEREVTLHQLAQLDQAIEIAKSRLPDEIITLYQQMQVINKLKQPTEVNQQA